MKIVILNECFLSDNQLLALKQDNDVDFFEITATLENAKKRIKDAEIILVDQFVCPLSNDILDEAKSLRLIIVNSTSYHLLDLNYLKDRNISLCNTPDFCSSSVAELVFLYTLSLSRNTIIAYEDNLNTPFEIYPDDMSHRKYV
jgi:lactate dehydrogenase-like 2-hydroxyacid dehydrogenase